MRDTTRLITNIVFISTTLLWIWSFIDHFVEQHRMVERAQKAQQAREKLRPEFKQAAACLQDALTHKTRASMQRIQRPVNESESAAVAEQDNRDRERFCSEEARCFVPVLRGNGMTDRQIFGRAYMDCLKEEIEKSSTAPEL